MVFYSLHCVGYSTHVVVLAFRVDSMHESGTQIPAIDLVPPGSIIGGSGTLGFTAAVLCDELMTINILFLYFFDRSIKYI